VAISSGKSVYALPDIEPSGVWWWWWLGLAWRWCPWRWCPSRSLGHEVGI